MANSYSDVSIAFHITFYEKIEAKRPLENYDKWKQQEIWKVGYLYEKSGASDSTDRLFRQSAFTVCLCLLRQLTNAYIGQTLATSERLKEEPASNQKEALEQDWTLLLLTPSGFFECPQHGRDQFIVDWKHEKALSKQEAELTFIVHALKEVAKRWTNLHDDIAELLSEDFMEPKTYVKLIFDDENFTRSRLYFWIIGCLTEFVVSIEDNIKQWKLFRKARVTPLLENPPKSGDESQSPDFSPSGRSGLQNLDQSAESVRENLENLQSRFKNQLETVKALRDGVSDVTLILALYRTSSCYVLPDLCLTIVAG